jgi:hypothetical protein
MYQGGDVTVSPLDMEIEGPVLRLATILKVQTPEPLPIIAHPWPVNFDTHPHGLVFP